MKLIISFAFVIQLYSCGLSNSQKEDIEFHIKLHNSQTRLKFSLDSIDHDTNLRIKYVDLKDNPKLRGYLKSTGEVFKTEWNKPYSIGKDYELTLDKYLDYCKAHNKDAATFWEFMD